MSGDLQQEQGFPTLAVRDSRVLPAISGRLVRDERGMRRCLTEQHMVGVARHPFSEERGHAFEQHHPERVETAEVVEGWNRFDSSRGHEPIDLQGVLTLRPL